MGPSRPATLAFPRRSHTLLLLLPQLLSATRHVALQPGMQKLPIKGVTKCLRGTAATPGSPGSDGSGRSQRVRPYPSPVRLTACAQLTASVLCLHQGPTPAACSHWDVESAAPSLVRAPMGGKGQRNKVIYIMYLPAELLMAGAFVLQWLPGCDGQEAAVSLCSTALFSNLDPS